MSLKALFLLTFIALPLYAQELPSRGTCDWSQLPPSARDVGAHIESLVENGEIASISFAIATSGKIVCEQSYGWADRERKIAATPDTPYATGSLAKSFTGTAIYLLSQRGNLKLSDTPGQHGVKVNDFVGHRITLEQLLTMTAGVPHGWFYSAGGTFDEKQIVQRYAIAAFPAGSFDYSNFSFGVLGEVVAAVSGKPYHRFLTEEILNPLGLESTSFEPRPNNTANGYHEGKKLWPSYQFFPEAAGGLYSSAHDLALYGMFHLALENKLLTAATLKQIHSVSTLSTSDPGYRAGWAHLNFGPGKVLWLSNGDVNAGAGTILILPEQKVVIVCALNTPGNWADESAMKFANAFAPGLLDKFGEMRKKYESAHASKSFAENADYEGIWRGFAEVPGSRIPIELTIRAAEANLKIGKEPVESVKDLHFESGRLTGQTNARLELPALGSDNTTQFELRREGASLSGIIRAQSKGNTPGYGLPVFVYLSRRH